MIHKDYSRGYALALLSLAIEEKKIKKYKHDAKAIIEALKENKKYIEILYLKNISLNSKKEMIKKAFKGINGNITHLIYILSEKGLIKILGKILEKLLILIYKELNIKHGVVYSVSKLTSSEIKQIEKIVSIKNGSKVELKNKIDKQIISGIKVVVEDAIMEDTIISRLEQVKDKLMGGLR